VLKSWMFALWFMMVALQARSGSAQVVLPGLPEVQAVNASAQVGWIEPSRSAAVPKTALSKDGLGLWGWGVETELRLPVNKGSQWEATLAVGYNQLSLDADIFAGRRLRGTLRDLPALSLYLGRSTRAWYVGVTIAQSELVNGRLIGSPDPAMKDAAPIKVAASSFSAGVSIGVESGPFFAEIGYMGRYFPSLQYDGIPMGAFPSDLGQRMYAGGFMVRIGGSLGLKKSEATKKFTCGSASAEYTVPARQQETTTCTTQTLTVTIPRDPAPEPDKRTGNQQPPAQGPAAPSPPAQQQEQQE
jgi:hypothetical protein